MKNLPFDTVDLSADDVQVMEDAYKALKTKFDIGLPDTGFVDQFELFNNEQEASISGTFLLKYPSVDCYLNFVKIHYNYTAGRSRVNNYKCQAWVFVNLKSDFGRVLIGKETLTDKILEMVHHTELKFSDDKVFSDNFYAAANDTAKALASMTPSFRNVIKENMYLNFVIEINGTALVIRNNQPIDAEQTIHLAELASKIAALTK